MLKGITKAFSFIGKLFKQEGEPATIEDRMKEAYKPYVPSKTIYGKEDKDDLVRDKHGSILFRLMRWSDAPTSWLLRLQPFGFTPICYILKKSPDFYAVKIDGKVSPIRFNSFADARDYLEQLSKRMTAKNAANAAGER